MRQVIQASGGDKDREAERHYLSTSQLGARVLCCGLVPGNGPSLTQPEPQTRLPQCRAAFPCSPCVPYTFSVYCNLEDVENQTPDNPLKKFGCSKKREGGAMGRGEESIWDAGVGACL